MSRIKPLEFDEMPDEMQKAFKFAEGLMGYIPNSIVAMAHWPEMLASVRNMISVIYGDSHIDNSMKRLIGAVVSAAAGCQYCKAHTTYGAKGMGVDDDKIQAVWEYKTSDLFNDAERAALDLAFAAGQSPNAATDDHFAELNKYYNDREKTEIMAVIGMFGFLNRWNDTLATQLEDKPLEFASQKFNDEQWDVGKHRR